MFEERLPTKRWLVYSVFASIAATGHAACDNTQDLNRFSVLPTVATLDGEPLRAERTVGLKRRAVIGLEHGASEYVIGSVSDVDISSNGMVIVADMNGRRVMTFDSRGKFLRQLGTRGTGPGEFIAPYRVAAIGVDVAVFDSRTGRVTVMDSTGHYRSSFAPTTGLVNGIVAGPDGHLLVVSGHSPDMITEWTRTGRHVRRWLAPPSYDLQRSRDAQSVSLPGSVCTVGTEIAYTNPWIYEVAVMTLTDRQPVSKWVLRLDGTVVRPSRSSEAEGGGYARGAYDLGLACNQHVIINAYLEPDRTTLWFDFISSGGDLLTRTRYVRGETDEFPGIIGGANDSILVTYRNLPHPQVFLYDIVGL